MADKENKLKNLKVSDQFAEKSARTKATAQIYEQRISRQDHYAERTVEHATTAEGYNFTSRYYDFNTNTVTTLTGQKTDLGEDASVNKKLAHSETIMSINNAPPAVQQEAAELRAEIARLPADVQSEGLEERGKKAYQIKMNGVTGINELRIFDYEKRSIFIASDDAKPEKSMKVPEEAGLNIKDAPAALQADAAQLQQKTAHHIQTAHLAGKATSTELQAKTVKPYAPLNGMSNNR